MSSNEDVIGRRVKPLPRFENDERAVEAAGELIVVR